MRQDPAGRFAPGLDVRHRIAENQRPTNFAVMQALPRIAAQDPAGGYLVEA
jgi:hypothetical protein